MLWHGVGAPEQLEALLQPSTNCPFSRANEAAATMMGVRDSTELLYGALDSFGRVLIDESGRPLEPADVPAARLRRSESVAMRAMDLELERRRRGVLFAGDGQQSTCAAGT